MLELKDLHPDWKIENQILKRRFTFKAYFKMLGFVQTVGWQAMKCNHHPEFWVGFNVCDVMMTTHDEGNTVTQKDFELALEIDRLYF